ncbi:hypothetical protein BDZ89DRAFT_1071705 [Hymenopellis radicata]|nr:hypothetical protein BDZ89DRAFT_1071705 [Hymenopellis radicata]
MTSLPKLLAGNSSVSVRIIEAGRFTAPASLLFSPVPPGHEIEQGPIFAFLIEHPTLGCAMFDLGIRKDMKNVPEAYKDLGVSYTVPTGQDVSDTLKDGGVPLDTVRAVIWSHYHVDHTGDVSTFPLTTELVIHEDTDTRTYPTQPSSTLMESDFANRNVRKLSFAQPDIDIAGLDALDYFHDGSLYILNTPGHCPGHISALARVTPHTFVLLGGDCCHHVGDLRPNTLAPCPSHILEAARLSMSQEFDLEGTTPLLQPTTPANATLAKLAGLDAHPDVLTLIAHDKSLEGVVDMFPGRVDEWKERGWKEEVMWSFMKEGNPAWRFGEKKHE